jgi:hypothetical protein
MLQFDMQWHSYLAYQSSFKWKECIIILLWRVLHNIHGQLIIYSFPSTISAVFFQIAGNNIAKKIILEEYSFTGNNLQ